MDRPVSDDRSVVVVAVGPFDTLMPTSTRAVTPSSLRSWLPVMLVSQDVPLVDEDMPNILESQSLTNPWFR